jgi:hypothetical protein
MGTVWDNPNQQVVRADQSGPGDEGTGGSPPEGGGNPLDAMTKDDLLAYANANGIEANAAMTKAEIRAAIDAAEAA